MAKGPFPAPVENWHTDTYPSIDPTRPELSVKGKKVIVTGGGAGIGRGTTEAFAKAGASSIAILGRRSGPLEETKAYIESAYKVSVETFAVDLTDVEGMEKAAAAVGTWDILVNNAGYLSSIETIMDSDLNEWWLSFEINIKGTMILVQSFFPSAAKESIFVNTSTAQIALPSAFSVKNSAYGASKAAQQRFIEVLAHEHPDMKIFLFHPGVVGTDMNKKSGYDGPKDTVELPSNFAVWLCSPEAEFARNRLVACNWDVDELKAVADKIAASEGIFRSAVHGFWGPGFQFE